MRSDRTTGPLELVASLARTALAEHGVAGLDQLIARVDRSGGFEAFRVDGEGASVPPGARRAGLAALRSGHTRLTETSDGFFIGYAVGIANGRPIALVIHPTALDADAARGWPRFLPIDLGVRALVMLVLGGLGCFLLARSITAPVTRLRQATQRLSEGDLGVRVAAGLGRRQDELADLGRDFDRMAERLEALVGAERRLLSDISHELRSPLARMNVALALLRQRATPDEQGMIARLETESARLNQLIGDVLTLSRAEAGEPVPERERVDLGDLATAVADDARFEAGGRVRDVTLERHGDTTVMGTPGLLRSAIENVVRNALRHTRDGTTVEIQVAGPCGETGGAPTPGGVAAKEVRLDVRDHGPGVPPAEADRIFEPFYRVKNAAAPQPAGTGLGLAIARRVMTSHGGDIRAALADGGGLVVTIRLPVAADEPA